MGRQSVYTREEKISAVKLVTEGGRSMLSVANEYDIHENTLRKWVKIYELNPSGAFSGAPVDTSADDDVIRLKRRIAELEAENNFLKKVSAYFAKDSR